METTYIMVKPDGVQRGLVGEVIKRFENKGYKLINAKFTTLTEEQAKIHYQEHEDKKFFGELIEFLTSGPVMAMVWEGEDIVSVSRMMIGKTKPTDSQPGTIRGDFSFSGNENVVHGSDSIESAAREISNIFG